MAEDRQVNWQQVGRELSAGMNSFVQQINEVMTQVAKAAKPAMEAALTIAQEVHATLHTAYIEEGAIYGDTHEGLMRWMKEKGKVARLRAEADTLEAYHEGLRAFRQRLIERGNDGQH